MIPHRVKLISHNLSSTLIRGIYLQLKNRGWVKNFYIILFMKFMK